MSANIYRNTSAFLYYTISNWIKISSIYQDIGPVNSVYYLNYSIILDIVYINNRYDDINLVNNPLFDMIYSLLFKEID